MDDDVQAKYAWTGSSPSDAAQIEQHLDEEKPEGAENESIEQIASADRIILNKCALVGKSSATKVASEEQCWDVAEIPIGDRVEAVGASDMKDALSKLEGRIRSINPHAPIIRAQFSQVYPKQLINLSAFELERVLEMDPEFLSMDPSAHVHDDSVSSVSWSFPGLELNVNKRQEWIGSLVRDLGTELFRYKGVLRSRVVSPQG